MGAKGIDNLRVTASQDKPRSAAKLHTETRVYTLDEETFSEFLTGETRFRVAAIEYDEASGGLRCTLTTEPENDRAPLVKGRMGPSEPIGKGERITPRRTSDPRVSADGTRVALPDKPPSITDLGGEDGEMDDVPSQVAERQGR